MTEERSRYLLSLYLQKTISASEQEELFAWITSLPTDDPLRDALQQAWTDFVPAEAMDSEKAAAVLSGILVQKEKKVFWLRAVKWSVAAAAFVAVYTAGYMYFSAKPQQKQPALSIGKPIEAQDAMPGTNAARLTLGNGSSILLDTLTGGAITSQGSTKIISKNGQIVYEKDAEQSSALIYNTLTTDRGHQYPLTLSDGTKVFLNAASSIRFPVSFNGPDRSVSITGEAYFEVAKNGKPFIVYAGDAKVEVMGTHFNINAYSDESTLNTTLLEGSVKVSEGRSALVLVPGQQAQIKRDGFMALNKNADTESAISWTQGYFHFSNASLEAVLRQLSRWYDVDIIYKNSYPDESFGGDIQKSLTLAQVLKLLDKSQVKFRIQGKQLIVME